ncbi:isoprenyl transferase [Lactococcus taiwanensis]|jgi:undecaprenyl diphosphate synthase|uniref:Isoprenyl transferase n=1 Tax=Lactococcus taiwanensis TaxID=1151742 RepID=A0AA45KGD3_9LACT|nr:isoprenyl transferase [Lactococcus taiwanensis]KZK37461.1 Undecaprenyl diphosphate synthase [Lactococcus cremoris]QRZ10833.1 isoprenyl transferase [Lactococcus taiwanensis]QSE76792.1 isoprenyl transferase [Lactococcus taiwanensis]
MFNNLKNKEQEAALPEHVGVIMDGNGRWAKAQGKPRIFGHKSGMDALKKVAVHGARRGLKVMTVYAFSTENWARPVDEVKFIMSLPIDFYGKYMPTLKAENIQIRMIGEREGMPKATLASIDRAAEETAENTGMILNFAMNYGGRRDIILGVQKLARAGVDLTTLSEEELSDQLQTAILPKALRDPDLIIRTSGEQRMSNFLTWQAAYSELYFADTAWPDFDEAELDKAISVFQKRERRYGGLK